MYVSVYVCVRDSMCVFVSVHICLCTRRPEISIRGHIHLLTYFKSINTLCEHVWGFVHVCVSALLLEDRRKHWISESWSYNWLSASWCGALGTGMGPLKEYQVKVQNSKVKLHSFFFCACSHGIAVPWDWRTEPGSFYRVFFYLFFFYNNPATLIRRQILSFGSLLNVWIFALRYRQNVWEEAWEKKHLTWFVSVFTTKKMDSKCPFITARLQWSNCEDKIWSHERVK